MNDEGAGATDDQSSTPRASIAADTGRQRILRLAFLALLVGGLLVWAQLRKPRALAIELDLTAALPGEVREIDLVVRRGERLLGRRQLSFDSSGAPQIVHTEIEATPGEAELEADLVYRAASIDGSAAKSAPMTRTRAQVSLSAETAARATVEPRARAP